MPRRFKVAIIGAGDMGGEHIKGWMLAGHEVMSVADIDLDRARALAATHSIPHAYAMPTPTTRSRWLIPRWISCPSARHWPGMRP